MKKPASCILCLSFLVLAFVPAEARCESILSHFDRPYPVKLKTSGLSGLARFLANADETSQREFAVIGLVELQNSYDNALATSYEERSRTRAERVKLARWQRATGALIAELERLLGMLVSGAPFTLHLDRHQQVLIVVDGQPVVISGPRVTDKELGNLVVDSFCAFNDCSWLESELSEQQSQSVSRDGAWLFRQGRRPAYEVGNRIRFQFGKLSDRSLKAEISQRAASEVDQLSAMLAQARTQGHRIDWAQVKQLPPTPGMEQHVVLNENGAYLRLELPLLAKLQESDWQRVVHWLSDSQDGILFIEQADRLGESEHSR